MVENQIRPLSGWAPLFALLLSLIVIGPFLVVAGAADGRPAVILLGLAWEVVTIILMFGLMVVNPNEARALVLFGDYRGTVRREGFHWVNPFHSKRRISLRARTFETGSTSTATEKDPATGKIVQHASRNRQPIKVNDRDGNPIEIAAVVVWKVVNTADALFEVDDYESFVHVQSEAALRALASQYHYDSERDDELSLRGSPAKVSEHLRHELEDRLRKAGVEVIEARISSLAYAPEIAAAMLQRQQATAVIAARQKIVDGAVGMVEMALAKLDERSIASLTPEQRAHLVGNLLVVLCSDRSSQPVLPVGSSG
jgi:regulator of protease activity HflC (stomatin/prohibitin superfamily)